MTVRTIDPSQVLSLQEHLAKAAALDDEEVTHIRVLAAHLAGRSVLPVLGAGASHDCGMRLASQIGEDLYKDYLADASFAPHVAGLNPNLEEVADAIFEAADQPTVVRAIGLHDPALWPGTDDVSDHFCAYRVLARLAREDLMDEAITFNYDCGKEAGLKAHTHHMYFRVDLDIDGFSRDLFEEFGHGSYNDPGGDGWTILPNQGKRLADPARSRKWRVRDAASQSALGAFRGYEIEIPQLSGRDVYSTGDIWVTVYRGDSTQQGADVGIAAPTDQVLEQVYANGPLDTVNGNDIVFWVAVHAHHEPRYQAEESTFLPYHYAEFSITPRGFEVFRAADRQPG